MHAARVALLALPLLLAPARADDKKDDKKKAPPMPSAEVVKAWQKAGFDFTWYYGLGVFRESPDQLTTALGLTALLPAFRPAHPGALESLAGLPGPKVPFALD